MTHRFLGVLKAGKMYGEIYNEKMLLGLLQDDVT